MTDLTICEHCRRTLLSGEHGPGLCGAPSKRPRWFPPHAGEPLEGLPWSLGRTPSDRAKDEARCAAVSALHACGDPWGLDASRLEQAESATMLIARVDAVLEDLHEAARRGRLGLGDAHGALRHLRDLLRPPGRFRFVDPEAVPWRNRAAQDPLAASLVHASGTDAEAADLFAAAYARACRELTKLVSLSAVQPAEREPEGPRGPSPSAGELPGWRLTTQGYVRGPWRIYQAESWCVAIRAETERLVARAFESPEEACDFVLMAAGSVLPARGADPAAHDPDGEMRRAGGS